MILYLYSRVLRELLRYLVERAFGELYDLITLGADDRMPVPLWGDGVAVASVFEMHLHDEPQVNKCFERPVDGREPRPRQELLHFCVYAVYGKVGFRSVPAP